MNCPKIDDSFSVPCSSGAVPRGRPRGPQVSQDLELASFYCLPELNDGMGRRSGSFCVSRVCRTRSRMAADSCLLETAEHMGCARGCERSQMTRVSKPPMSSVTHPLSLTRTVSQPVRID